MNLFSRAALVVTSISILHLAAGCAVDAEDTAEPEETTASEMKWKPLPGEWVDCDFNGMKCRCKGDVIDCRAATGDGGTKASLAGSFSGGGSLANELASP